MYNIDIDLDTKESDELQKAVAKELKKEGDQAEEAKVVAKLLANETDNENS